MDKIELHIGEFSTDVDQQVAMINALYAWLVPVVRARDFEAATVWRS